MNISANPRLIQAAENTYHQLRPRIDLNPDKQLGLAAPAAVSSSHAGSSAALPEDILSMREKETLQALFSSKAQEQTFYGSAKVQNIQSGFLLDIKG